MKTRVAVKKTGKRKKVQDPSANQQNSLLDESDFECSEESPSNSPKRKISNIIQPQDTQDFPMEDLDDDYSPDGFTQVTRKIKKSNNQPAASVNQSSSANKHPTGASATSNTLKATKPKPIFVDVNYNVAINAIKAIQLTEIPVLKILSSNSVAIHPKDTASKVKIIEALDNKAINFHTFTEKADRKLKAVLKGFFKCSNEELLKYLKDASIPAVGVSTLYENDDRPVYFVLFPPNVTSIPQLNQQFKIINYLMVRWEAIKPSSKRHTQCGRCKRWGHTSSNCNRQFRCIKCIEPHLPGECKRVSRDAPEGNVACVNCQGPHPANSTACPAFKAYIESITKKRKPTARVPASRPGLPARTDASAWPCIEQHTEAPRPIIHPGTQAKITPSSRVSFAEKIAANNTTAKAKVSSEYLSSSSHSQSGPSVRNSLPENPILVEAINHLQTQLNEMIKKLHESFMALCQNLVEHYGH